MRHRSLSNNQDLARYVDSSEAWERENPLQNQLATRVIWWRHCAPRPRSPTAPSKGSWLDLRNASRRNPGRRAFARPRRRRASNSVTGSVTPDVLKNSAIYSKCLKFGADWLAGCMLCTALSQGTVDYQHPTFHRTGYSRHRCGHAETLRLLRQVPSPSMSFGTVSNSEVRLRFNRANKVPAGGNQYITF
jgi:hypothetical protein